MASSHIDLITERKQKDFSFNYIAVQEKKNVFLVPCQKLEVSGSLPETRNVRGSDYSPTAALFML